MMGYKLLQIVLFFSLLIIGCNGEITEPSDSDIEHDRDADLATDTEENREADGEEDRETDPEHDGDIDHDRDGMIPLEVPVFNSLGPAPERSVLPESITSCAIYQETRCESGLLERCMIYDGTDEIWVEEPAPLLEEIYWYDRYYDLYHQMEGQHAERYFTERISPGTPEEEWSRPEYFERLEGFGDASGWTGTVLQGAAARYQVTGTQADYDRMIELFESMAFL